MQKTINTKAKIQKKPTNKFGVKVTDILRINSMQTSEIKPGVS